MSSKNITPLGAQEHEILRAMARTTATPASVPLSSTQRLRFEMLGLIEDRADGIRLTERGRALAAAPTEAPEAPRDLQQQAAAPRDRRGRRLGLRRRSPF